MLAGGRRCGFSRGMNLIALHEATHETLALVAAGQLIQVAGGYACDRAEWEALAYHEQQEWRVRAAGLSVREAVLVGKSMDYGSYRRVRKKSSSRCRQAACRVGRSGARDIGIGD